MSDWPFPYQYSRYITLESNRAGVPIYTDTSANTKKATYTEILSSTPVDVGAIEIKTHGVLQLADFLIDLAIGAAGSEQIIVPNMLNCDNPSLLYVPKVSVILPIFIPAGSRISANAQSTYAGENYISLCINGLVANGEFTSPQSLAGVLNYGADTSDSGGLQIDPGGTAGVKGSYVQIAASTPRKLHGFFFIIGNKSNTARTNALWYLDIAIGGAGSEVNIISDWHFRARDTHDHVSPSCSQVFYIPVPSGSRISARAECSINDATDRLFDISFYGIY